MEGLYDEGLLSVGSGPEVITTGNPRVVWQLALRQTFMKSNSCSPQHVTGVIKRRNFGNLHIG